MTKLYHQSVVHLPSPGKQWQSFATAVYPSFRTVFICSLPYIACFACIAGAATADAGPAHGAAEDAGAGASKAPETKAGAGVGLGSAGGAATGKGQGKATLSETASGKKSSVLKILQKSKSCGEVELFLDANGMQMRFKNTNMTLFCKAPDWTIYKYNPATKKYWTCAAASFTNNLMVTRAMTGSPYLTDVPVQKTGQKSHEKYNTHIYTSSHEQYVKVKGMYDRHEITGNYPLKLEVSTLDSKNCSPEEGRLLSIVYLVPKTPEPPLTVSGFGCDGKNYLYLTTSLVSTSTAPTNWLELPAHYKKVATENKLTEDEQLNESILDFMNTNTPKH